MAWHQGVIEVGGTPLETSWKTIGGVVVAADIYPPVDMDAPVVIDGQTYVIENLMHEKHQDGRMTVPLITAAEMEARLAAEAGVKARDLALFEGKPWPAVAEPEPQPEPVADGQ